MAAGDSGPFMAVLLHLICALVRVSVAVQRHREHSNSHEGKQFIGVAYSSEVPSIVMVGRGSVRADMVLQKELRILYLDPKARGDGLSVTLSEQREAS